MKNEDFKNTNLLDDFCPMCANDENCASSSLEAWCSARDANRSALCRGKITYDVELEVEVMVNIWSSKKYNELA